MIFIDTGAFLARVIQRDQHHDAAQGVSFTDCISFVLMAGHGIRTAFSFDNHFLLAGFEIEP